MIFIINNWFNGGIGWIYGFLIGEDFNFCGMFFLKFFFF